LFQPHAAPAGGQCAQVEVEAGDLPQQVGGSHIERAVGLHRGQCGGVLTRPPATTLRGNDLRSIRSTTTQLRR